VRLGLYPGLSAEMARERALGLSLQVARGQDPFCEQSRPVPSKVFTVRDLWEHFAKFHLPKLSPKTAKGYEHMAKGHVLNAEYGLGAVPVDSVTRREVQDLIDTISEQSNRKGIRKIGQAKKVKGFVSALMNYAVAEELRDAGLRSPLAGVRVDTRRRDWELDRVEAIGHTFEPDEVDRVWDAFERTDVFQTAVDALRLIALTGVRSDEARSLTWDSVVTTGDFPHIRLRRHKTDKKVPIKEVPLCLSALEVLARQQKGLGSSPVFPSPVDAGKPVGDLWTPWSKIRKIAGVPRARVHDLRGLAACQLLEEGWSEAQIQAFMGWDSPSMVRRYISASKAMKRAGAKVLDLGERRRVAAPV